MRQLKEKLELQGKEIEELKAQIKNCLTKGTTFGEMFRNP